MPTIVNRPNEIDLNGVRYPLGGDGQVHPVLSSRFAPKQVIGDYSKDSDPNRSIWSICSDQSGGIGVEELGEAKHLNRSWWTSSNTDYAGHQFLPGLVTTSSVTGTPNCACDFNGNTYFGSGTRLYKLAASDGTLSYVSVPATITDLVSSNSVLYIFQGDSTNYCVITAANGSVASLLAEISGSPVTLTPGGGAATITITDVAGGATLTLTLPLDCSATLADGTTTVSPHTATYGVTTLTVGATGNFTITVTRNDYGIVTNGSYGTYGYHWDGKLFKITAAGQLAYSAAPAPTTGTPTWTNNGLVDIGGMGSIQGLIDYVDDANVNILYCRTTRGLLAHDYANAIWLNTDLKVPAHTDNGKGCIVSNGKLYYSSGLSVYEYSLGYNGLTIKNIGPDKDDGLPDEYVGSITKVVSGYEGVFYAFVDASLISSSNTSTIIEYENGTWRPVWVDSAANKALTMGFATSTYAYRIWWSNGTNLNWMAVNRARRNPLKTTTSYAASSFYISPWFDADWIVGNTVAYATRTLARSTTATETVTIKYRINKTNVDVATGWTTHDTLVLADAGVESVVNFGSNIGLLFNTIQFRVDLARGDTTTLTPDLVYLILEYEKVLPTKWGWSAILDCTKTYNGKSPSQLLDALITAAETQLLIPMYYKGTVKYVRIAAVEGSRITGDKELGQYNVMMTER